MATHDRTLIGVVERLDLPDWGVRRLRAKIDTGARTSALHVDEVEEIDGDRVRFSIVLDRRKPDERVSVEAPITRRGRVRSSSGRSQKRLFVRTRMVLGGVDKEIEISLASREPMIFRMLLGRQGLASDFFVDPANRYLQSESRPPKKARISSAAEAGAEPPKKKAKKKKRKAAATEDAAAPSAAPRKKRSKKKVAKKASSPEPAAAAPNKKRSKKKKTAAKKTAAKKTTKSKAAQVGAPAAKKAKKKRAKKPVATTGAAAQTAPKRKRRTKKKATSSK